MNILKPVSTAALANEVSALLTEISELNVVRERYKLSHDARRELAYLIERGMRASSVLEVIREFAQDERDEPLERVANILMAITTYDAVGARVVDDEPSSGGGGT